MKKLSLFTLFICASQLLFSQAGSQIFTSSGSFVVPPGITTLTIEVVGAGGSGGGNGGGGGGGGGYAIGAYAVTAGASLPVTIGNGGTGSVGGTSSVGSLISASGGANGTSVSNPNVGGGGAGGVGTNGNIVNRTGGAGGGGYYTYFGGGGGGAAGSTANGSAGGGTITWTGICQTPGGTGGAGGGAPGGNGGKGAGFTDVNCNITDPSAGGSNYGGGGGGANGNGGIAGTGANGYAMIAWGTCTAPASPTVFATSYIVCVNHPSTLYAISTGSVNWYTTPSGGSPIATTNSFVVPSITANTTFYAEAITCTNSIVRTAVTLTFSPPLLITASPNTSICPGSVLTLTANGASTYVWEFNNPGPTSFTGGALTTIPQASMIYTVTGSTSNCTGSTTVNVSLNPRPTLTLSANVYTICEGQSATITAIGASNYTWTASVPGATMFPSNSVAVVSPTVMTDYYVAGANSFGCVDVKSVTISVKAAPNVTVNSSNLTICAGTSASLTVLGAQTYTWNTNSSNTMIVVSPPGTSVYTVTGTGSNGCERSTTITQSVALCTGIVSFDNNSQQLSVFPNPNKGEFSVKGSADLQFNVINESGQVIATGDLNAGNKYLYTVKNLRPGIYFIGSKNSQGLKSQKIVVSD